MAGRVAQRLAELNIVLPEAPAPAAAYVPTRRAGATLYIAGQVPFENGKLVARGKVGREFTVEQGAHYARICGMLLLAQAAKALDGDLDRIVQCLKVTGFVNAVPEFGDHPKVINGASELLVAVLGDAGRHARSAVGMGSLPFDVPVEVEAIFEVA